jgi:hypothetical protein
MANRIGGVDPGCRWTSMPTVVSVARSRRTAAEKASLPQLDVDAADSTP